MLAEAQVEDEQLKELIKSKKGNLREEDIPNTETRIWCDTATGKPRPYVPASLRKQIFKTLHSLAHPGIKTSQKFIKAHYMWPEMNKDIQKWTQKCLRCQQAKIFKHTKTEIHQIKMPDTRFAHIHIDIVGPLPCSCLMA